jgi:N-acetylglutamate synthase-like GNAT family acetyltransferase
MNIQYRQLTIADIKPDMLKYFNRYHEVTKSWRKQNGEWMLVDNAYIENWDENRKTEISTRDLPEIIKNSGFVFGAFDEDKIIGFASIPSTLIGSKKQFLQLEMMLVSLEYRQNGIGRRLFSLCVEAARKTGMKKLYISANSSQETIAFYRAMGCDYADEIITELFEAEPFDVHMEYGLVGD